MKNSDNNDERQQAQNTDKPEPKNAVHRLYDKIPMTYKQVDLLVKILIGLIIVILIIAIANGSGV